MSGVYGSNVSKFSELRSCQFAHSRLNQVEERENEHPNKVYKVPVEADFLNHLVVATLFKRTVGSSDEAPHQQANTRKYVRTVETGDKEKQVGEQRRTVLIHGQIGPVHHGAVGHTRASTLPTNKVRPLDSLAAKEHRPEENGPQQPLLHIGLIHAVASLHRQHHSYGAEDENHRHQRHESQRQIHAVQAREGIKYFLRDGPMRSTKEKVFSLARKHPVLVADEALRGQ